MGVFAAEVLFLLETFEKQTEHEFVKECERQRHVFTTVDGPHIQTHVSITVANP